MAQRISLQKADVWDDNELLQGWEEAQAEYKQYHSIRGKRPEEVLTKDELRELFTEYDDVMDDVVENPTSEKTESQEPVKETAPAEEPAASGHQEVTTKTAAPHVQPAEAPTAATMPQAVLGTVQDENLKNLMMSWYYAGYYTALCQGQQQGPSKKES
ncbi:hypothetical protein P154DRAFT_573938 [Amniculicola lignicola CBS 123094]|uniref:Survival motor neuron Tudor domain-containing protein n=1 Tax=Amniculicola lignicola CBS 123094 TaxID=1392246 RepID=A0A6A5WRC7_9PLEO|nr:hypothetical protein P154DRAFT_573938 [Amniculicola lignicola CBS 123094]